MTEKELGQALLNVAPAGAAADSRHLANRIAGRDRRRLRVLAGLATTFWVLSVAGVIWLPSFYFLNVAPRLRAYGAGRNQLQNDWEAWARVGEWAAWGVLACVTALLLAALATVLLIVLSRRATLRQINASLAEISDRLRLLGAPGDRLAQSGSA